MNTRRWAVSWGIALLLLAGCGAADILGVARPSVRVAGYGFDGIGLDAATIRFELAISNPYAIPLPLGDVDYALSTGGAPFLSGRAALTGSVPARGSRTVVLPVRVAYAEVLEAVRTVRPGNVLPYRAEMGLSVDAPGVGPLRLPLRHEGSIPVPALPDVSIAQIRWKRLTLNEAGGSVEVDMVNRNDFAFTLSKLVYGLSLGGVEVATGTIDRAVPFAAGGGRGRVEIPVAFSPSKAGLGMLQSLMGQGGGYGFRGVLEIDTDWGRLSLPVNQTGETTFRR